MISISEIKNFFAKIFGKTPKLLNEASIEVESTKEHTKDDFISELKLKYIAEDEKLKIFKMFRNKEIKEEQLTEEQVKQISDMYDKRIEEEKKKIAFLKSKIKTAQKI